MDEWISKIWYLHTIEHYSALEMKEIMTHATKWMNLEDIMKEDSHKMANSGWAHLYEVFRVVKFIETENQIVVARGLGQRKGGIGSCLMGTEVQVCMIKKVLEICCITM